ncbi:MAG: respiratory chain complex I subunit 1 family protein [Thermoplasmatota archaeon]
MDALVFVASVVAQTAVVIALAPLIDNLASIAKAAFQSRRGPPLFQPYYDLWKHFRKDTVASRRMSWVARWAPYASFAAFLAAAEFVPIAASHPPLSFGGDLFAVIMLFALAHVWIALAALDGASSFGGLGSSRDITLAALAEPSLILAGFTLAVAYGATTLGDVTDRVLGLGFNAFTATHLLLFGSFFMITIAETGRIPIDNPATHLELTMVHEAQILEFSGKELAVLQWGLSIKELALVAILANVFAPWGIAVGDTPTLASFLIFTGKAVVAILLIASAESLTAKWRLFRLIEYMTIAFVLAFFGLLTHFILGA